MTRHLLWDAGPGEIRAGLVEDGALVEFRIIRMRVEVPLYQAGEQYTARLVSRIGNGQARVSLGVVEAILSHCPKHLTQGALLEAVMTRAPWPEPGRWKPAHVIPADDPAPLQREAGWHFSAEPYELFLRHHAANLDSIICANAQSASEAEAALGNFTLKLTHNSAAIEEADFESLIEQIVSGVFPLGSIGALSIERTRAMTVIDVDGDADPLALNLAAAAEIPRLLRLLDICGPIAIDFVTMANKSERVRVMDALDAAATRLGPFERTMINGYGLCQIIRPRTGPSLPEIVCGTGIGRLSNESRAVALLRAAGRSTGFGKRQLIAPPAVIDVIRAQPWEIGALRSSLGVEIELIPDASAIGYGLVHVAQS